MGGLTIGRFTYPGAQNDAAMSRLSQQTKSRSEVIPEQRCPEKTMDEDKGPDSPETQSPETKTAGPDPWALIKPDWDKWKSVKRMKLWEAIALALDVDPSNFYFFGERKLDTVFNNRQPPRFAKLLEIALGNISAGGVLKPDSIDLDAPHESEIKVSNFVKWAKSKPINAALPSNFPGVSISSPAPKVTKPSGENERSTLLRLIAALAEEAKLDMAHPSKTAYAIEDCTVRLGARVSARTIENHLKRIGTVVATPLGSREHTTLLILIAALAKELDLSLAKPATAATVIKTLVQNHGSHIEAELIEDHLKRIPRALDKRSQ